jgi:queuine tRNA-ribosyltransferase
MFELLKQSRISPARRGEIRTRRGILKTPFFMPDATRGFIKTLSSDEAGKAGTEAMVINTFHLYLSPGTALIKKAGGAHKFMDWSGPLLSDSGGYQVYSLINNNSKMGRITDEKAVFKSPLDGSVHELTPEKSVKIQFDLGADMIVALDDCPSNSADKKNMEKAVERTIRWAKRSKKEFEKQLKSKKKKGESRPLIFGVVQGGLNIGLRQFCANELTKIGFDGYGFGARPVDAEGNFLAEVIVETAKALPGNKPRFALGIGTPEDIIRCSALGWDMFDCVIPTREGRHGRLFNWKPGNNLIPKKHSLSSGANRSPDQIRTSSKTPCNDKIKNTFYNTVSITNSRFASDMAPINPESKFKELKNYSKAFLHHLFKMRDPFGARLASLNNLEFYNELTEEIRDGIKGGRI